MKRILTILSCVMVLFTISSCTKQYVTPNNTESVYANIAPTDWSLYSDNKSYMASIDVADIDNNFANTGAVIVAISYEDGVYEQLPETYNGTAFSYTYNDGNVTIYAQAAGGTTAGAPAQNIKAKITLIATN